MEKPSLSLKDTGRIYLDHNATTPVLKSILPRLTEWASLWGNPSSIHQSGRGPKTGLRESRQVVATGLGVHPLEIIFTSGGSESNTTVIKGVFHKLKNSSRTEYICSSVEHPSVIKSFQWLKSQGAIVHFLNVNKQGELDLVQYRNILTDKTALVSVMFANNETGVVHPISEMCEMAHEVGALFHTDAVQALGKVAVNLKKWAVDFATFSGHKVYALKGAGIIYSAKNTNFDSLILGGGQERGRRAGTENTLAICALAHAMKSLATSDSQFQEIKGLRDYMESEIARNITDVNFNAQNTLRIPNTSNLFIDGIDGETLLINLDIEGISVSTGAACSSGNPEPSPVLLAMGFTRAEAQKSLRVSLGVDTTKEEIDTFVYRLKNIVTRLRNLNFEKNNYSHKDEVHV
jgi:cysteine desulfurase